MVITEYLSSASKVQFRREVFRAVVGVSTLEYPSFLKLSEFHTKGFIESICRGKDGTIVLKTVNLLESLLYSPPSPQEWTNNFIIVQLYERFAPFTYFKRKREREENYKITPAKSLKGYSPNQGIYISDSVPKNTFTKNSFTRVFLGDFLVLFVFPRHLPRTVCTTKSTLNQGWAREPLETSYLTLCSRHSRTPFRRHERKYGDVKSQRLVPVRGLTTFRI